ncbi:MAG: 23S rRNA (pseudouridine(1915)-N(3))-methyltransferase RlmH [Oscillospiraceae bacterium]|nr:23S rRNA (pseudouridine(1915)-N(3))-methyltransferase RlmH [Oscillospiraceae bacterium]MCM0706194.1 23S rRNA (pseudouridine(1915)-N(3))-methyltransferase RlmH [Faecalicatena sp. BF-R-105]MDY3218491.1 23S rRNA (pseudouridine(1915)-N(3))-methyltransferase RlmH [Candidatus Fimivivens sp.]GKH51380.1 ribosomal RNA large subunit methyltransferase H [Eubacteriales bacterium]MCI6026713.1 23S rRNA (pseudouridine(1915)-N(3))-methyltransferase RlmH [Oscillospiraceae bacterium]
MRNIQIVAVGRLKEHYLTDGCAEYCKRLSAFGKVRITELEEARLPEQPSEAQIRAALEAEGERIIEKAAGSCLIALCVEGKLLSSEELARTLDQLEVRGTSAFTFVIGSSFGLCDAVKKAAALRLSFSRMTFPHQLMRLMLCEQLYRACSISAGGRYHK